MTRSAIPRLVELAARRVNFDGDAWLWVRRG